MPNNSHGHSIQRPYEIIETEETITRFYNPTSPKGSTFSNKNYANRGRPEQNSCEEDDPEIVLENCQFQTLYEKFNKMRSVMSELKEKLKKINLAKNHSIPLNEADTGEVNDLSSTGCHKTKLQEDLEESKAENDDNIRNCVSLECPTDLTQPQSPSLQQEFGDVPNYPSMNGDTEFESDQNQVEAPLLRQSKKILINLIDQELHRVQSSQKALLPGKSMPKVPVSHGNSKHLKMKSINRITEELAVLKDLEGIYGS